MSKPTRQLGLVQCLSSLQRILKSKGVSGLKIPCSQYFSKNRRHLKGAIAVGLIMILSLLPIVSFHSFSEIMNEEYTSESESDEYQQWHQVIDAGNGSILITNQFGSCSIAPPVHPSKNTKLNPVLAASFPGNPSDSIRFIIEAVTGTWTSARTFRDDVVAIKTHYPYFNKHIGVKAIKKGIKVRAIFLLRNPLDSIEALQRYSYNNAHNIQVRNRTPLEYWISWRDENMKSELIQWQKHIEYWLNNVPSQSRVIVVHENLIDDAMGPTEAQKLIRFLSKDKNLPMPQNWEEITACVWQHVIKLQQVHHNRRLQSAYEPPYFVDQLDLAASILTEIIDKYDTEKHLVSVLLRYRDDVLKKMQNLELEKPIMVENSHGSCIVTESQYGKDLTPVFQASYPASGSEFAKRLTEALTGIKTSEFKREDNVISVNTFYPGNPYHIHKHGKYNDDMNQVILLLRNPIHAITSNFYHLYEKANNLELYSGMVPSNAWIDWRDDNFMTELQNWKNQIEYWMDNFNYPNRLIITYEALTDKKLGDSEAKRIVQFLNQNGEKENIPTAPLRTVSCLWYRIYTYYKTDDPYTSKNSYNNKLTTFHLESIATDLNNLNLKYRSDTVLGSILGEYWGYVISLMK